MNLLTSSLLLLALVSVTFADCPDFQFSCPSGGRFTVNTCFSRLQCYTCTDIKIAIQRSSCPKHKCGDSVDGWYGRDDGCSAKGLSKAVTNTFRAACGIHDMCYATPNRTQRQCDDDFHYNMKETCKFPGVNGIGRGLCNTAARIAYTFVQIGGKSSFDNAQRDCVRNG